MGAVAVGDFFHTKKPTTRRIRTATNRAMKDLLDIISRVRGK